jgi:ssDNA-binding Zn-finger/Zn-ribbon topoisomerase 1
MGLTCSLFGHDYAERGVERERADHGAEIVTSVRTTETCRRCGDARVISENTEVTAASAADGSSTDSGEERSSDATGTERSDPPSDSKPGYRPDRAGRRESDPAETDPTGFARIGTGSTGTDPTDSENDDPVGPTAAVASTRSLEDGELQCQNCEFVEAMLGSALRAGDSCPDCGRGYLVGRTRKG